MPSATQPHSPLAFLLLLLTFVCVALIIGVYLFAPPGQESVVAENVGYTIGNGMVKVLIGGWLFIAAHALISLIVNGIFALCYFSIVLFSRLWT